MNRTQKMPRMRYTPVRSCLDLRQAQVALPEACPPGSLKAVRHMLQALGVTDAALRPARAITLAQLQNHPVIALGHMDNNSILQRLYELRLCLFDAEYPGPGGYAVTTAANALGLGQDVLMVGGHDEETLTRSIQALAKLIAQRGPRVGYVHAVKTLDPLLSQRIQTASAPLVKKLIHMLEKGIGKDAGHHATEQGLIHYLTGCGKGLEVFRDYFLHYLKLGQRLGNFSGHMVYSFFWKTMIVWDLVQCDPLFTPAVRRRLTQGFFDMMTWLYEQYGRRYFCQPPGEIRHNHWTYTGISLYLAMHYFTKHHRLTPWDDVEAAVANLFEGQCRSYKVNDDASGYSTQVPRHLTVWLQHRGRTDYLENGHMRRLADTYVVTTDNTGSRATYGDAGNYSKPACMPFHHNEWMRLAHWFDGDPALRWLMDWSPRTEGRLETEKARKKTVENQLGAGRELEGLGLFTGLYRTEDRRRTYPYEYVGVRPLVLDEAPVEWVQSRKIGEKRAVPKDGVFVDKMSLRASFRPQDEYLMLEGTGTYAHGHQDANGIVRLSWKDRIWLIDCDYLRGMPEETNGLKVIRNGSSVNNPPLATLDACGDLPATGFTHTTARGYGGGDWHRKILWSKGGFFLVQDAFTLYRQGEYTLEQRWRVLGTVKLRGQVLQAEQAGEVFHIAGTVDTTASLRQDTPEALARECDWSQYPHADETIAIQTRAIRTRGKSGSSVAFCSLLTPQATSAVERQDKNAYTFRVGRKRYWAGFDVKGRVTPKLQARAAALLWGPDHVAAFGVTRFVLGRLSIRASKPIDMEIRQGMLTLDAASDVTVHGEGRDLPAAWPKQGAWQLPAGRYGLDCVLVIPAPPKAEHKRRESKAARTLCRARIPKHLCRGMVTALDGRSDLVLAGFADGRVQALGPDCGHLWSKRLSGCITAVGARKLDGELLVAAISSRGEAAVYDAEGRECLRLKRAALTVPADQVLPIRIRKRLHLAISTGQFAMNAAGASDPKNRLQWSVIGVLNRRGKLLWTCAPNHGASGCLAVCDNGRGEDIIAAGSQYHSALRMLAADGTNLASPWIRMDSTAQCMTALCLAPFSRPQEADVIYGTLGHTVFHFPLPGDTARARKTYGPGRGLHEARLAGAVQALRVIGRGRSRSLMAVDAAGMVARFDKDFKRTAYLDMGMPAPVRLAAISALGAVYVVDERHTGGMLCADGRAPCLHRLPVPITHVAFCGDTPVGASSQGLLPL